MKKGGIGGANTKTGLAFEIQTDFPTFLSKQPGYSIKILTLIQRDRGRVKRQKLSKERKNVQNQ